MRAGTKHSVSRPRGIRALCLAAIVAAGASAGAAAQTVKLVSPSGGVDLSGRLVAFEDGVYTLETLFGTISVAAARVRCIGDPCPETGLDDSPGAIRIAGADRLAARAVPGLLEGFAASLGGVAAAQDIPGGTLWRGLTATDAPPLFAAELRDLSGADSLSDTLQGGYDLTVTAVPPLGVPLTEADAAAIDRLERDGAATTVALQGVLLVVHPRNRIDNLTPEEISALLTGRIDNWSRLGGADLPVRVVAQPGGGLVGAILRDRFLDGGALALDADAQVLADDAAVADEVAETPGAIGVVGLEGAGPAKPVGITVACGLTAEPGTFSAKTGEYPLHHRLVLLQTDDAGDPARALREYAASEAADATLRRLGLLDMSVVRHDQLAAARPVRAAIDISPDEGQVNLLRELYIDMLEWDRLSTTFRFDPDQPLALSAGSGPALERLGAYLRQLPAGTEIAFVGFTDGSGSFDERLRRAQFRADVVMSALAETVEPGALSRLRITGKGYADLKPVGCFADEHGRRLNRRVEVWVRR
ncbi:hypothetical protein GE300_02210 [Rhodobacteraceae bacterium 2CG4]|uniref:OmpA-like domain-containing protein n=1 Tax=Halovulum marinum TaxID=2662447 RepID=A0A6L5YWV3_9RHOB|nr:phosphate ABC transporter substrate-binding/OmpA family protein [Halovulum marinum]MSU88429.1 hypothetical protein [Halovulum marinum]